MNVRLVTLSLASGAAALAFAAPAAAAPSGPQDVGEVVMKLQESGNTVIVNRIGNQPLSQCTVAGVRAGHTYSRFDSGYPGAQMDPMSQVVGMTVYVDANC
jgi:hypothetical protein